MVSFSPTVSALLELIALCFTKVSMALSKQAAIELKALKRYAESLIIAIISDKFRVARIGCMSPSV